MSVLILFPLLSSCAGISSSTSDSTETDPAGIEKAGALFQEGKYADAVGQYRKLAKSGQKQVAETAQFQLARALAFYKNPGRNYAEAVVEFKLFIKRYPSSHLKEEASNWNFIIEQYFSMKSENGKLREDIKKLVDIDIDVGKKQRQIK